MGEHLTTLYTRIMATEEGRTGNVYYSFHYNLTDEDCSLSRVPVVDDGITCVYLQGGGEITPSTAASASKDGSKEMWSCFEEKAPVRHARTSADVQDGHPQHAKAEALRGYLVLGDHNDVRAR
ncbi:hypothetical protein ACFZBU_33455 [Embleya sp. NPDC008237]|uniref:hypothetical protein n=1 Tax=Embleya sp. NPDC008237 TaxID=3363978 RepID=UPI0036ECF8C8